MRTETVSEVLKQFFASADVTTAEDVGAESELGRQGVATASIYTRAVKALMAHGNPLLSKLGHRLWQVIHLRLVHTALTDFCPGTSYPMKTLHFFAGSSKSDGTRQAVVFMPMSWPEMVQGDPVMHLGGVIFTGSQAVDYANGRVGVDSVERIRDRPGAYEAEMLKSLNRALLNEYQLHILGQFPNGFESRFGYTYRDPQASQA